MPSDMSKSKKILVVGGAFLLGAIFLVMGWTELRNSKKLAADGKAVTAEVAGKYIKHGRKGRRSYYLDVAFKTDSGSQSEQRVQVSSSQFDEVSAGSSVPVHYLPSDPSICQVGDKVETKWSGLLVGFGSWAVAAFLAFAKPEDDNPGDSSADNDAGPNEDAGGGEQQKAA
jgi:hypothetical protein